MKSLGSQTRKHWFKPSHPLFESYMTLGKLPYVGENLFIITNTGAGGGEDKNLKNAEAVR